MAVRMRRAGTHRCPECLELVDGEAVFCPVCGTRQLSGGSTPVTAMPGTAMPGEPDRLARSANAWILAAIVVMAALLVAIGILAGRLSTTMTSDATGDDADGDAAQTMDSYAPYAEMWAEKHSAVADEAIGDDPNGLATAAEDARLWIDANREDLGAVAASAQGGSADLYQELMGIFDQRAAVLGGIEATATAGGDGAAAADDLAVLEGLDQRADEVTCEIADVMRAGGDDPDDQLTPAMGITC